MCVGMVCTSMTVITIGKSCFLDRGLLRDYFKHTNEFFEVFEFSQLSLRAQCRLFSWVLVEIFFFLATALTQSYIITVLWCPAECQYSSKTKVYIGNKANKLTRELVADAEMKVMAVKPYCEQYLGSKHFQMGQLVYDLRHKYARVVYLYQLVDRDVMYRKHKHNTVLNVTTITT